MLLSHTTQRFWSTVLNTFSSSVERLAVARFEFERDERTSASTERHDGGGGEVGSADRQVQVDQMARRQQTGTPTRQGATLAGKGMLRREQPLCDRRPAVLLDAKKDETVIEEGTALKG